MATQKLYIAKLEDGTEIGPVEQDALVKLAENGTVTPGTLVRSKLIPEWNKAGNVDFLKAIIFRQQQEAIKQQVLGRSLWTRLIERITLTAPQPIVNRAGGLVKTRSEHLPKAPVVNRFLAGLVDALILTLLLGGVFYTGTQLLQNGTLHDGNAVNVTVCAMLAVYFLYFTLQIGLGTNQTLGQRFFGILLIRTSGKPFWMIRAFFFALFLLPCAVFSPIYLIIGTKTYPEMFTGTRLAKAITAGK